MATFQTAVNIPELSDAALESWYVFLTILGPNEIGPHIGPTSAAFVSSWESLSSGARTLVLRSLEYIVMEVGSQLGDHLDDVVDLSTVPALHHIHQRLKELRKAWTPKDHLQRILDRSSSVNLFVAILSLGELKTFMLAEGDFIRKLASGDVFDPMVGQIVATLLAAACRDGEGTELLRLLAFECIGVLGAVDPDRCEIKLSDPRMVMLSNFTDEGEAVLFALHLIRDLLVGAFRSTSDLKYQSYLAYSIQELLRFCQFTPALVAAGNGGSLPLRVRNRWNSLPKHVLETVTPLLEGRFTLNPISTPDLQHPIYPSQSTYREWIQLWTVFLITKAAGRTAQKIFSVFRFAVRNKDVAVAHHILPHLVLNILISGDEEDAQGIRLEILAVLEDQVDTESGSTADKKLLSAQVCNVHKSHEPGTTESFLPRSYSCCWITLTNGFELYAKMLALRKRIAKDRGRIKSILH
jgi:serine/threonine-protein kinase ATR